LRCGASERRERRAGEPGRNGEATTVPRDRADTISERFASERCARDPASDQEVDRTSRQPRRHGSTGAFVGAVTLIVDQFTGWSAKLLGANPSSSSQAALAIAITGAMAIVFAADLLARGYASAHTTAQTAPDTQSESKAAQSTVITVSVPKPADSI
jgi:hypothetical protein